jgi:hypothetical protein
MSRTPITAEQVALRQELALLLKQAAELEHAVMCQYIFAAVSMKTAASEGGVSWANLENMRVWRAHIMTVAREEMEHLGLVINLLTAIGEAPVLQRRNFPFTVSFEGLDFPLSLEPFSVDTVRRFALIEMPQKLERDSRGWQLLGANDPHFSPAHYDLIARLYDRVEELFTTLPEDMLFIGPADAQFVTEEIFPGAIRGISLAGAPAYNVDLRAVIDRPSAVSVIQQIKEEGEGAKEHGGPDSHFAIFLDILEALMASEDPGFAPGRPCVVNPTLVGQGPGVVTHPVTRKVMALFDTCYHTLVLALIRYFAHTDESETDLEALQQASFFPMMTTVIRPLAECLTRLPAHKGGPDAAGPSFVLPDNLAFLPHRRAAFELLHQNYSRMVDLAEDLSRAGQSPDGPPELKPIADRVTQVYETLWRSRMNLEINAGLEPRHE